MRCKMRSEVELDEDGMADLRQLNTLEKIVTSIRISLRNTKMAKNRRQREVEQAYRREVEEEEGLKSVLLQRIYNELVRNNFLDKKGLHTRDITLAIDARMEDVLKRIITHKDFVSYDMSIIEPNSDVKKCFTDTPILLNIRKKVIMEDSYEM